MGKIDTIDTGTSRKTCLNLSSPVGPSGANLPGDVMVIQSLFRYIAASEDLSGIYLGNWSVDGLPEVSGEYDIPTFNAISTFVNLWRRNLIKAENTIHPASYNGRVLRRYETGKLMTITLLSQFADDVSMQIAGVPYIRRIFVIFPQLKRHIEAGVYGMPNIADMDIFAGP